MIKFVVIFILISHITSYVIDDSPGLGRRFDGIGGLSGGGATSKLLVSYSEPQRSQILDYLFKPNFGASLHILKVEIGGDSQSTEGTESSHMHNETDENYDRGYEWWLMKEAKARNPNIKLYGLPWAFPGWLGKGSDSPYKYPNITANYIIKWIQGAKKVHGLDIDYIGVWNERNYDITYIETLKEALGASGLENIKLVAPDGSWSISNDVLKDAKLAKSLDIIGSHYPGTMSTNASVMTKKQLWASEDYSTFNDNVGAGCWARILNQNYVNGLMTSTISWNLIASYYPYLPYDRCGLMTAMEPWTGHYVVEAPIWATAHTTQFTMPGMKYLSHGSGVGHLDKGGSYVSFVSESTSTEFTLVIETMSHNHSVCIRPRLPPYTVTAQTATFQLKGKMAQIRSLFVWYSKLGFNGESSMLFTKKEPIKVDSSGSFSVMLGIDEIWTLTTLNQGMKGAYPVPPMSKPFPLPYSANFTAYPLNSEAPYFVPQVGVWEIRNSTVMSHSPLKHHVNTQVVTEQPIDWCKNTIPINLGGNFNWTDIFISVDVNLVKNTTAKGAFIAARVDRGGCDSDKAKGLFFWVFPEKKTYFLTNDIAGHVVILNGTMFSGEPGFPLTMSLVIYKNRAMGSIGGETAFSTKVPASPNNGFVAYGASNFGLVEFDNLYIDTPVHKIHKDYL